MKILVDAHVLDEPHQGTRTYIKGLYCEVIKRMPDTDFYFIGYNKSNLQSEIGLYPNVTFLQLKYRKVLRLLVEIPFLIWKHKIDYAHFQYVSPPIKNCKHIVTIHDLLFKDYKVFFPLKYRLLNDLLFRFSALRADVLFTVSQYSRDRIKKHYGISEVKIGITPNGVPDIYFSDSTGNFKDLSSQHNLERFILYVSRIEPRKNHILLLKAFCELELWKLDYTLVFIGKRDFLVEEIDTFIEKCPPGCRAKILLINYLSDAELALFYKAASLFVYPSFAEGFGIPPIEAVASGVPTLCSNTTAMSDFSFLGEDFFDPYNLNEIKLKIVNRLSSNVDFGRINMLKDIVKEKYSWAESSKIFISFLRNQVDAKLE